MQRDEGRFACALDAWIASSVGATKPGQLISSLEQAQWEALAATFYQAKKKSAFYARALADFPMPPRNRAELARLPLTHPQDLRKWEAFVCCSLGDIARMVTLSTSGTTGEPKRLAFTEGDLARTRAFFRWGMQVLLQPGQTLAVLLPGGDRPNGVADLLRQALSPLGCRVFWPPSGVAYEKWLTDLGPDVLVAMPSQLRKLLRVGAIPRLTGVLSSAEWLDPALAAQVSASFGVSVINHYGLTETGYGFAVECHAHTGMHIRALDFFVEIVDCIDGHVLPFGRIGELVVTTLHREAMPLIRYKTGDLTALLPGPCGCGSPLQRLGPLFGRIEELSETELRAMRECSVRVENGLLVSRAQGDCCARVTRRILPKGGLLR